MRLSMVLFVGVRILLYSGLFLAAISGMALGVASVLAWFQESAITEETNLYLGMVCGLIALLFLAVFHLRRETLHFPFSDREVFLHRLKDILNDMGYDLIGQTSDQLRFHPSFKAFLLGGGISIKLENANSTIIGPRFHLEILRQRIRLQQHLDMVQQSYHESRRQKPEHLLKRVQLTIRMPQNHWTEVIEHLQSLLATEAEMIADLHILLQSTDGIRESVIDQEVRQWLHERGLVVDIHKNHVKMLRPSQNEIHLPPVANEVPV